MTKGGRFEVGIRTLSAWIVVVLVVIAARFVMTHGEPGTLLRVMWYVLIAIATLRALHRTWLALQAGQDSDG